MHCWVRKMLIIFMFNLIMCWNNSTGYVMAPSSWAPTPMTSIDAAITSIKELKGFLRLARGTVREINVDQFGMQVIAVEEGVKENTTKFWIGWDLVVLPNNTPYRNEYSYNIAFNKVKSYEIFDFRGTSWPTVNVSPYTPISFASWEHARKFVDAVTTLAIAQNAVLDPYYNFILFGDDPSAPYRKKVFMAANVAAGALVSIPYQYETDPGKKLEDGDIIVQATYDEKVIPINNDKVWDNFCREAVAGKAEATITAKVIRTGLLGLKSTLKPGYPQTVNIEIRVTNPGFGVHVALHEPARNSATPPKGLGISLRILEADEMKTLGIERTNGFFVLEVAKGSIADKMQIRSHDLLLALNGIELTSFKQLQEIVAQGAITSITVFRTGAALTLRAPLTI